MTETVVYPPEGGDKGEVVNSVTLEILNRLTNIPVQSFQDELNRVAGLRRERWRNKIQNTMMIEERLPNISYAQGIRELDPSFLLNAPSFIYVRILDLRVDDLNPKYSANRETCRRSAFYSDGCLLLMDYDVGQLENLKKARAIDQKILWASASAQ